MKIKSLLLLALFGAGAAFSPTTLAQDGQDAPKYYNGQPGQGQGGEYFDSRTMRWYTRDGQICSYCTPQNGFGTPIDQMGQNPQQSRYTFSDGFFFSPYELAWFDRSGECLRCDPSTGFWIPDEFRESAEYRKERRRFANLLSGPNAPLADGRPSSAPRAGTGFGGGGFNQALTPVRFDARQMRWVDQNGQICQNCTPESGFWIPPQFANEAEFRSEQQRYASLIGTMRREVPPPTSGGFGSGNNEVECSSKNNAYTLCRMDIGRGVTMVRQLSKAQCTQNQSWGFTREGIWVDRGCRARFAIQR